MRLDAGPAMFRIPRWERLLRRPIFPETAADDIFKFTLEVYPFLSGSLSFTHVKAINIFVPS